MLKRDSSDPVLLLAAYQKWQESCVDHIRGRFAFVIHSPSRNIVFGARDPSGSEPLFYSEEEQGIRVAQNPNELLSDDQELDSLDEDYLLRWVLSPLQQRTKTFHTRIKRLPPGHSFTYRSGHQIQTHRYWFPEHTPYFSLKDPETIWRNYADILKTSIDFSLPSSGTLGAHASGGLDSSVVYSWARKTTASAPNHSVTGFSWHPEKPEKVSDSSGEYLLLKSLERTGGQPIVQCPIQTDPALDVLHQDITRKPWLLVTAMMMERSVQTEANQRNINTMLTGWGGDEIASQHYGQTYRCECLRQGRLSSYAKSLPSPFPIGMPLQDLRFVLGLKRQEQPHAKDKQTLLHPDCIHHVKQQQKADSYDLASPLHPPPLHRWNQGHLATRIEAFHESGRELGIRYEHPLLDQNVMEFALRIPLKLAVHPDIRRLPFRHAISSIVPPEINWAKTKSEPLRQPHLWEILRSSLAKAGETLRARSTQPKRANYFDMPRLIEQLEPKALARRQHFGALVKAMAVLDF